MLFSQRIFWFCLAAALVAGGYFFFRAASVPLILVGRQLSISKAESQTTSPTQKPEESVETAPITLLFGGDLMFDRFLRTVARRQGVDFILAPIQETLAAADLVVANLEGPITEQVSVSEESVVGEAQNYVFTFDPAVASFLKRAHIEAVNLGNNHILNFGEAGVGTTKKFLTEAGVDFFGSPLKNDERILIKNIRGTRLAFVNYNQFVFQGKEKAFANIERAHQAADVVILYTHWGTEYVPVQPAVKDLAHSFIDAGADLIIGSHPHIVQDKEVYKGKLIYYSLGNMVFDQYFSPETQAGLLVRVTLNPVTKVLTTQDISIHLRSNGQTERVFPETRSEVGHD